VKPKQPPSESRNVIAQAVIAFMVCIGAYMLLVDPKAVKLAAAKAEEDRNASEARSAEALRDLVPQISKAEAAAKAMADKIHQTGRLARQEQELYAALTSAANTCHIRIDQMSPTRVGATNKAGQAGPEFAEGSANAAVGYTIDATSTYNDLAAFLKIIRTEIGYSLVKSVRMSPTPDSKLVHAFIETEHFSFDASPPADLGPLGAAPGSGGAAGGGH